MIILFIIVWLVCGIYIASKEISKYEHIDTDIILLATFSVIGGIASLLVHYGLKFSEYIDTLLSRLNKSKINNPFYKE